MRGPAISSRHAPPRIPTTRHTSHLSTWADTDTRSSALRATRSRRNSSASRGRSSEAHPTTAGRCVIAHTFAPRSGSMASHQRWKPKLSKASTKLAFQASPYRRVLSQRKKPPEFRQLFLTRNYATRGTISETRHLFWLLSYLGCREDE